MRFLLALLAVIAAFAVPARAQDYPNRPITMIVPFPPGGGNDTLARIVATKLSAALGQQVIVDNRGGANGTIAIRAAVRAAPDGYTLIFVNSSNTSITPALGGWKRVSTSSDTTRPSGPTCSAIHAATVPAPEPTSQHDHPRAMPM